MTRVAVVVVTFNGQHCIGPCLDSICETRSELDVFTYLVDNLSTDTTLQIARSYLFRFGDHLRIVESNANLGFGIGNNIGISAALADGADYVFLLNQDAMVEPQSIGQLVQFLDTHKEFGVCSPLHMSPNWKQVDIKTYEGYLRTHASQFVRDALVGRVGDYYEIFGVNAAAWFFRRSTFDTVGGFDPLFFMYGEDDDYLNRLRFHGVRFALVPSIRILHLRESPLAPPIGGFVDAVLRKSKRCESNLLGLAKAPDRGELHGALQILVHGIFIPICQWLIEQDSRSLMGWWIAAGKTFLRFPAVAKARRLTRVHGSHYLNDGT